MKKDNRQGGSVVLFIIVGAVLAALALGALYLSRQFMASQRTAPVSGEGIAQNPGNKDDKSSNPVVNGGTTDGKTTDDKAAGGDNSQSGGQVAKPAPQPDSTGTDSGSGQVGQLPKSGPAGDLLGIFGLTLLTVVGGIYINSLRLVN